MSNANLESSTAVGYVHITKHDSDGNIIEKRTFKNQLTNYSRACAANMWAGNFVQIPSSIQVGTGSPTAPATGVTQADTELWTPMDGTLKVCDFATVWLTYNTQYSVTYDQPEAVGTWTELGLFDPSGNLWSHVQLNNFVKEATTAVTVQWQIQHIGN